MTQFICGMLAMLAIIVIAAGITIDTYQQRAVRIWYKTTYYPDMSVVFDDHAVTPVKGRVVVMPVAEAERLLTQAGYWPKT